MPAAAVIPAPVVYIKVVAVKKLVVGLNLKGLSTPSSTDLGLKLGFLLMNGDITRKGVSRFYFELRRVFKTGECLE